MGGYRWVFCVSVCEMSLVLLLSYIQCPAFLPNVNFVAVLAGYAVHHSLLVAWQYFRLYIGRDGPDRVFGLEVHSDVFSHQDLTSFPWYKVLSKKINKNKPEGTATRQEGSGVLDADSLANLPSHLFFSSCSRAGEVHRPCAWTFGSQPNMVSTSVNFPFVHSDISFLIIITLCYCIMLIIINI